MPTQKLVNLNITDMTRQLRKRVSVRRTQCVREAVPEFVTALELPVEVEGQPASYGVTNETSGQRLGDTDRFGETTNENDVIRLDPEITAAVSNKRR